MVRTSASAVPSVGKELAMLLPVPYEVKAGEGAHGLAKLGSFWGSVRGSSPMTQCRWCSVAPVSVICVRWILSWCCKLPVKKREQYDLDDAAGCYSAERCTWGKKFQILSITYFCCSYPNVSKHIVRALRALMSHSGSVQPRLEFTPVRDSI